jgi:hypothetical protein
MLVLSVTPDQEVHAMRLRTIGMLAATGLLATTAGLSGTAVAAESGVTAACPKGAFCMYTGLDQSGTMYTKYSDWSGTIPGIRSVYNNGSPQPGYDHVSFTLQWAGDPYNYCLHYPGDTPYKMNFVSNVVAQKVVWRGEC